MNALDATFEGYCPKPGAVVRLPQYAEAHRARFDDPSESFCGRLLLATKERSIHPADRPCASCRTHGPQQEWKIMDNSHRTGNTWNDMEELTETTEMLSLRLPAGGKQLLRRWADDLGVDVSTFLRNAAVAYYEQGKEHADV